MSISNNIFSVGLLTAFYIALAHASAFGQDKSGATGDVVEVVVLPGTQIFPVSVMQLKGFDRKHGFTVKEERVAGIQGALVRASTLQFHVQFHPWTTVPTLRSRGIDVVNVDATSNFSHPVLAKSDSKFKTWKDLKGAVVGLPGSGASASSVLFRYEMKKFFGLDSGDYNVRYGETGLLGGQLERGDIDAALMLEPLASKFLASGQYRSIGGIGDAYKAATGSVPPYVNVMMNGKWAKENPDLAKRFLLALRETQQFMRNDAAIWPELGAKVGLSSDAEIKVLRQRVGQAISTEWNDKIIDAQTAIIQDMAKILPAGELGFPPEVPAEAYSKSYAPSEARK